MTSSFFQKTHTGRIAAIPTKGIAFMAEYRYDETEETEIDLKQQTLAIRCDFFAYHA